MAARRSTRLVTRAALAALAGAELRTARRYRFGRVSTAGGPRGTPAPGAAAILLPRGRTALPPTVIDGPTLALLRRLQRPAPLAIAAPGALEDGTSDEVARLVLDGLLEAHLGRRWFTGPAALALIATRRPLPSPVGALERLSRAAIVYGARLGLDDVSALAEKLYRYNTVPDAPRALAGAQPGELLAACDDVARRGGWRRLSPRARTGWWAWTRSDVAPAGAPYKLYVSPSCRGLADAAPRIAGALCAAAPIAWKAGTGRPGWLRPDKVVAYFETRRELGRAARLLRAALRGIPGHGVPFTAALTSDGLLSWGIDRAPDQRMLGMESTESWRVRLTQVVARALVLAGNAPSRVPSVHFALVRVAIEGADPLTFEPLYA